ncbi:MAG: ABC transporter permease [Betaproteobacteria bacterium]|nr:ABC transporter permease [Betaproteobacteria bacterium]
MAKEPSLRIERGVRGQPVARVSGDWILARLAPCLAELTPTLDNCRARRDLDWDLSGLGALDTVGGLLLWQGWEERFPPELVVSPRQRAVLERVAASHAAGRAQAVPPPPRPDWIASAGGFGLEVWAHLTNLVVLLGQLVLDAGHCLRHPGEIPLREISANVYKAGVRAMPVTALVGFLIGIVLSYLSALQLRNVGADIYIVNILGYGIVRELGPVLVAVLVAGRSGSAMTAQLGVMRVTEEIDALATFGVSRTLRLVLPKVVALSLAMPLLVLWTTAMALWGGMVAAQVQLDIGYEFFIATLPRAVPVANLWIGLAKGVVFGFLIALIASHFGLHVRPNTESLSANTTRSVVISITSVLLVDAVFAVATRGIGVPV